MVQYYLTCEHGGNQIPEVYEHLFLQHRQTLVTHRGYDIGALSIYQFLKKQLKVEGESATTSRLLVELNRSLHHPNLFSKITAVLSKAEKNEVLNQFYFPYRNKIENQLAEIIALQNLVVHLSCHSFTPELNGLVRNADIGILYNPKNLTEKLFAISLKRQINQLEPSLKVRFNYPYLGTSDGFTVYLRQKFKEHYAGIELEVNQKFMENNTCPDWLNQLLYLALKKIQNEGF